MKNIFNYALIFVFSAFLGVLGVSASTYTSTTNLFENSYSNNLIDMAQTQIDNFSNKKYVIFQSDQNYYLVSSDDFTINGNNITFTDTTIISAIRNNSSYNSYYTYNSYNESNTVVSSSYVVISNIDFKNSVSSKRFSDYQFNKNSTLLLTFILGLIFALFVTKERKY